MTDRVPIDEPVQVTASSAEETFEVAGPGTRYRLQPPYLLPVAVSPAEMIHAARTLLAGSATGIGAPAEVDAAGALDRTPPDDERVALRQGSTAGFMLLCAGCTEEAVLLLSATADRQAAIGDFDAAVTTGLRLVQALQSAERVAEAVELAREVVLSLEPDSSRRHFALHHLGKALLQSGAVAEARDALTTAFRLREALGDTTLMRSTRQAMALLDDDPAQHAFATLAGAPREHAPDGSELEPLLRLAGGSMARFTLPAGAVSRAVRHRSVEEIWYVAAGAGELWRSQSGREETVSLRSGMCLTIPLGTAFQFRASATDALIIVAVTMPPWPGEGEAEALDGPWTPVVD